VGKLGVAVWNVRHGVRLGGGRVTEGRDDIAQGQQATVDRYPFFDTVTYGSSSLELPRS